MTLIYHFIFISLYSQNIKPYLFIARNWLFYIALLKSALAVILLLKNILSIIVLY